MFVVLVKKSGKGEEQVQASRSNIATKEQTVATKTFVEATMKIAFPFEINDGY